MVPAPNTLEFESIAGPPETLRKVERKSCKTTFLGSQKLSLRELSAFWFTPSKPQRLKMANMWWKALLSRREIHLAHSPGTPRQRRLGSAFSASPSRAARLVNRHPVRPRRRRRGSTGTANKQQAIAEERRQRERLEKSYSHVIEDEAREQQRTNPTRRPIEEERPRDELLVNGHKAIRVRSSVGVIGHR